MNVNNIKARACASGFAIAISVSPQRFTHRRAGICFCHGIEVAIDICRCAHVAMSEPFLDLLHWHALGKKHRGAGVAKTWRRIFLCYGKLLQQTEGENLL